MAFAHVHDGIRQFRCAFASVGPVGAFNNVEALFSHHVAYRIDLGIRIRREAIESHYHGTAKSRDIRCMTEEINDAFLHRALVFLV